MSDESPVLGYQLRDLDDRVLRHPADRAATAALKQIPGLDGLLRKLIELGYERALHQQLLASSVRLGPQQLPETWTLHHAAFATLAVDPVPDLYLTAFPLANAATIGSTEPLVLVRSETLDLLDAHQQRVVFAHEAAHVMCDHVLYGTALRIIGGLVATGAAAGPLPTKLSLIAIRHALLEWSRAAELTCDRIAALVVRDPLLVCRTLMSLAAGTASDRLNLDAFLAQADDYGRRGRSLPGRWTRMSLELGTTHPLSVTRAHQLMEWVKSGDYERIRDGDYPRRSEGGGPTAGEEAFAAADYYKDKISGAFKDIAGQAEQATRTVNDWLSKNRRPDDDA
ncbi:M48 family metallopeptidase [Patulibacter brassicae]|uniref:M48 family metallopeptidase n=1 Tax=Patulibacter brassicae TaxID=1705717 RepID=A0ABU4VMH1_9ACTN|nr:M48 family metallopeptidase [Patulibacter brassicae]MDX8152284.1 M48 family metallopeptidase [Patulibacter brassicae]